MIEFVCLNRNYDNNLVLQTHEMAVDMEPAPLGLVDDLCYAPDSALLI